MKILVLLLIVLGFRSQSLWGIVNSENGFTATRYVETSSAESDEYTSSSSFGIFSDVSWIEEARRNTVSGSFRVSHTEGEAGQVQSLLDLSLGSVLTSRSSRTSLNLTTNLSQFEGGGLQSFSEAFDVESRLGSLNEGKGQTQANSLTLEHYRSLEAGTWIAGTYSKSTEDLSPVNSEKFTISSDFSQLLSNIRILPRSFIVVTFAVNNSDLDSPGIIEEVEDEDVQRNSSVRTDVIELQGRFDPSARRSLVLGVSRTNYTFDVGESIESEGPELEFVERWSRNFVTSIGASKQNIKQAGIEINDGELFQFTQTWQPSRINTFEANLSRSTSADLISQDFSQGLLEGPALMKSEFYSLSWAQSGRFLRNSVALSRTETESLSSTDRSTEEDSARLEFEYALGFRRSLAWNVDLREFEEPNLQTKRRITLLGVQLRGTTQGSLIPRARGIWQFGLTHETDKDFSDGIRVSRVSFDASIGLRI